MADPCNDCGEGEGNCGDLCSFSWTSAITSCMSQLGVTPNMSACVVISNIASAICNLGRCIDKTAFVTPCGSDLTGELGNFMKPFKTIKAAVKSTTSNSGHMVYVWPGTYTETLINKGSDGVEKTGLTYYFSPGVTITSTGGNLWTTGMSGSTVIRGAAVIQGNLGIFNSTTFSYDFDIECLSIESTSTGTNTCVFFSGGGTFRLKCSSMKCSGQSVLDVRTTSSTGYVECDVMDNQNATQNAPCVKFNTGGTHNWTLYVKELKTTSNATNNGAGILITNPTAKVYWKGNVFQNQAAASGTTAGLSVQAGTLIYEGDVKTVTGHGAACSGGTLVIRNSTVRAGTGNWSAIYTVYPNGNGLIIANNCMLVNNGATVATVNHDSQATGSVQLTGCLISNESATSGSIVVKLSNVSQAIRLNNCNLYTAASGGVSISASVNVNTRIINCWTNKAVGGAGTITDLIQAINVNSTVIQTIYT